MTSVVFKSVSPVNNVEISSLCLQNRGNSLKIHVNLNKAFWNCGRWSMEVFKNMSVSLESHTHPLHRCWAVLWKKEKNKKKKPCHLFLGRLLLGCILFILLLFCWLWYTYAYLFILFYFLSICFYLFFLFDCFFSAYVLFYCF